MKKVSFSISIVIPNWNGKELLAKNLPSVISSADGDEIIIVDDGSSDGSVGFLKEKFPEVKIISKEHREGFASTVNIGVASAKGEIIVLLNTDVRPTKNFLAPLVTHFSDSTVFAVGCLDQSHEHGNIELRGCGEAVWNRGFFIHKKGDTNTSTTAWVSGGSGAFRKSYWEKLGGMDTLFNPFYWEDIDLSYRALKAGYRVIFDPKSVVDHYHEEGKIISMFSSDEIKRIAYRNQLIFIWKNLTDRRILMQHFFWLPLRLVQSLAAGDLTLSQGFISALGLLTVILKRRESLKKIEKVDDQSVRLR